MKLNWEFVEEGEGELSGVEMHRARVKGGWLYRASRSDSFWDRIAQSDEYVTKLLSITFVPEPA